VQRRTRNEHHAAKELVVPEREPETNDKNAQKMNLCWATSECSARQGIEFDRFTAHERIPKKGLAASQDHAQDACQWSVAPDNK